ncbi:hypothetical protein MMC31_002090 [Peltigera leucophlebia]|nr:hypothetical protein [Peltigera leucophlebia]
MGGIAVRSIYRSMEEELGDRTSGEERESNEFLFPECTKREAHSQHLLNEVKKALERLACFRFVKPMTERAKLGEQEYQPSSKTEEK